MKSGYSRRVYGTEYEQKAETYLRGQGYRFIDRNVNFKSGEIDLVFEWDSAKGVELVFVEVRKRDSRGYIRAEESITFPKARKLKSAIRVYLAKYQGKGLSMRVDLIAFQDEGMVHFQNFLPLE
jgi:putative endonuclease